MKWCCFLFWFVYRLVLACLAHFNWCVALYTNCIYFSLWKSYDLLWFWMHLMLCTCFPPLRRENYLIVWTNLIWKGYRYYPNLTYKQLYMVLYGGKGTKAERALQRMDTIETRERESRRLRRITETDVSSSSSDEDDAIVADGSTNVENRSPHSVPTIIAEEERECRKFAYVGEAVDSQADMETRNSSNQLPVPPPRPSRSPVSSPTTPRQGAGAPAGTAHVNFNLDDSQSQQNGNGDSMSGPPNNGENSSSGEDSDTNSTSKWIQKVPNVIRNKFKRNNGSSPVPRNSSGSLKDQDNQDNVSVSTWSRIRGFIPNPFNRSVSNDVQSNELDVLRPDYTNTYDAKDEKSAVKRKKRDKKALTSRLRKRIREELKEAARKEKKRRMITDAIELLLQLLRMMTSFAVLIGNIRKTFIPAQFKYLKPGQHAYDNYELLLLFRMTTFLDVAMFWSSVMWVYCLQWHLCCRLGFLRFWSWAALLAFIALTVMIIPMSYAMNQMDLSWCRFLTNSTLEKYQPAW